MIQNNNINDLKEGVSSVFQSIAAAKNALTSVASLAAPLIQTAFAQIEQEMNRLQAENKQLKEEIRKIRQE